MRSADASEAPLRVLAAIDHLPAHRYALVVEACDLCAMTASPWRSRALLAAEEDWPAMIVAGLPSGTRRLPPDLYALLSERFPRLPLLLLCEEALVRPTVVSHGGRIVLVGAPLTSARVASRIRMLTANARRQHGLCWSPSPSPAYAVRDRLAARHWVGCLGTGSPETHATLTDGEDGSLIALLPLAGGTASMDVLLRIADELARETTLSHKEASLTELLGDRYAAVHLPPSGEQWTVYRTGQGSSLRLSSPQRLPKLWDHPRASRQSKLFVKRAASGDVMVMTSAEVIPAWNEATVDPWVGGPGLLARFVSDASSSDSHKSTLVVEVL